MPGASPGRLTHPPIVAFACCAARDTFTDVTSQLLRRLHDAGHLARIRLHLIVAHTGPVTVPTHPPGLHRLTLVDVRDAGTYAQRRNRAMAAALDSDVRYLLFYDDDEHWVRPRPADDGVIHWEPQDPLTGHLAGFAGGAVLTCGIHLGQLSPIPSSLPSRVRITLLRRLGGALRGVSEFLCPRSFVENAGHLRWRVPPGPLGPLPCRRGVVPLTGANLGIDLQAVRDGRIPPFYNPREGRGEDALLGARVRHLPVHRVRTVTFHDPFGRLRCDRWGEPRPVDVRRLRTTHDMVRFADALRGWIAYGPMLVALGGGGDAGRPAHARLDRLQRVLDEESAALAVQTGIPRLAELPALLARRRRRCAADVGEMVRCERVWRRRFGRRPVNGSNGAPG